ncbi:SDR family NAD(P)-dependent oxidoreductase [Sinimarinibacterium sp. CAU 1509]|uniref:SDR family NAD(P)-dependent oxidoreductase n=1 Tax=Sinimarinibacterium sp. CAU 1509 TaxID=2562283 RepID=UPI0010ACCB9C|nr:SDR family NAD(P)-dependent oxidoreductase [Sinimarinibacterium sp. CAU 1509]TJY55543.1 SDR family NAD(P)-dependent oxidoreductase [Sinimarinibacterium sp. CAU 1509]
MAGRHVIVTGAAAGSIGFETACILAGRGAHVTVTTRSAPQALADRLNAALGSDGVPVEAMPLDLAQRASVDAFVADYSGRHGDRLDVLINNAGIHLDLLSQHKTPQRSADGIEIHWRTNYLGTMQLTLGLLPALRASARQSGDARIVNVVSQLHRKGGNAGLFAPPAQHDSWVSYGLSKLALVHATFELQRRFGNEGLQAYCLHPGAVYTHIADKGLQGNPVIERLRKSLAPIERYFLLTPTEGAQTSIHCASATQLRGGRYFRNCAPAAARKDADDIDVAARLWAQTERWIAGAN